MPLTISDEILKQAGLDEREALIEFACRLFDAEKLPLPSAAKLAGLNRIQMETELRKRRIPIYRPTLDDWAQDLATIEKLERLEKK